MMITFILINAYKETTETAATLFIKIKTCQNSTREANRKTIARVKGTDNMPSTSDAWTDEINGQMRVRNALKEAEGVSGISCESYGHDLITFDLQHPTHDRSKELLVQKRGAAGDNSFKIDRRNAAWFLRAALTSDTKWRHRKENHSAPVVGMFASQFAMWWGVLSFDGAISRPSSFSVQIVGIKCLKKREREKTQKKKKILCREHVFRYVVT